MTKMLPASLIALLIAAPAFAQGTAEPEIQPVITVTSSDDCDDEELFPTQEERDACLAVFAQGGTYGTEAALAAAVAGFLAALAGGGGSGTTTTTGATGG